MLIRWSVVFGCLLIVSGDVESLRGQVSPVSPAACPPADTQTLCIDKAHSPYVAPANWPGISRLIMLDQSELVLDPIIQKKWVLTFDSVEIGSTVTITLSPSNTKLAPPPTPGRAASGNQCSNGNAGGQGQQGVPGVDTAALELYVGRLSADSLIVKRHAGDGGPGGLGQQGGGGGSSDCLKCAGGRDGGYGGQGGPGGPGGNVLPVLIQYHEIHTNAPIADDFVVGQPGVPGLGNVGGQGSTGSCGSGHGVDRDHQGGPSGDNSGVLPGDHGPIVQKQK